MVPSGHVAAKLWSALDAKRTWIPIDLAQGIGSKSSVRLFGVGPMTISPNPGRP